MLGLFADEAGPAATTASALGIELPGLRARLSSLPVTLVLTTDGPVSEVAKKLLAAGKGKASDAGVVAISNRAREEMVAREATVITVADVLLALVRTPERGCPVACGLRPDRGGNRADRS